MPKNKRPNPVDSQSLQSLSNTVPLGFFSSFSGSSQAPSGLSWGGSDCKHVVVAASAYPNDFVIPDYPPEMTPNGTVFLVRRFRENLSVSPPRKVDDTLYFSDREGRGWSIHSKDAPDHHRIILSASGMSNLLQDFNLPSASSGPIADYRKGGAHLDFENPFWNKQP